MSGSPSSRSSSAHRAVGFVDKGGTGKTTTLAHLGVVFENELDYETVLIDLAGKQGDLAKHFGVWEQVEVAVANDDDWPNIATTFQEKWGQVARLQDESTGDPLADMILSLDEGPDLIPTSEELDGIDSMLNTVDDPGERYARLDAFLTEYVDERYDVILIDAAGSSSNITMNALRAAGHVVALSKPAPFDEGQARKLRTDLKSMVEQQTLETDLTMVMLNELDGNTIAGREFLQRFEAEFGPAMAPQQIPSTQDIINAQMRGTTLFELEDPLATAERAMDAYRANATELARRFETCDWMTETDSSTVESDISTEVN
ncbi:ParA family protein [Halococcus thailandensis]|uniref:ParA family protein n=1 Tax=Halococcus thailandensis TaxID=335952 RepID=UPI00067795AD|nr:ParA family protein [Halococcus thailandensis]